MAGNVVNSIVQTRSTLPGPQPARLGIGYDLNTLSSSSPLLHVPFFLFHGIHAADANHREQRASLRGIGEDPNGGLQTSPPRSSAPLPQGTFYLRVRVRN